MALSFFWGCQDTAHTTSSPQVLPPPQLERMSNAQYGINVQSRQVLQATLKEGQFMTDVLEAQGVSPEVIDQIEGQSQSVFDVRRMQAGRLYTLIHNRESKQIEYFIYEKNESAYVVFDLREGVKVYEGQRKVTLHEREVGGWIQGSLFQSVQTAQLDMRLVQMVEDVYLWTVDFFELDKGDYFKLIYEEERVDDIPIGIKRIVAAQVQQRGVNYYAFFFEGDTAAGYFDEFGYSLQQPLSGLPYVATDNPIPMPSLARWGMDYRLPAQTAIASIGRGEVKNIGYDKRKGHYISVRHSGLYTSQYLFLSEVNSALTKGSRVEAGAPLGIVGKRYGKGTPMLRFRLWRDDDMVHPRDIDIPPGIELSPEKRKAFETFSTRMMRRLETIELAPLPASLATRD